MAVTDVGTARGAVTGSKLVVVGAGTGRVEEADGCEDAGVMAITDVGTARGAVTGGKLVVDGAGTGRLEEELEGINGTVGVADGSEEGVDVDGVARV